jgi:hypothetical protein
MILTPGKLPKWFANAGGGFDKQSPALRQCAKYGHRLSRWPGRYSGKGKMKRQLFQRVRLGIHKAINFGLVPMDRISLTCPGIGDGFDFFQQHFAVIDQQPVDASVNS